MKCLLKYKWVKLPREDVLPCRKEVMGHWVRLAARAAFRSGKAKYCGHINEVEVGSWVGGIVGLKSILQQKSRAKVLEILEELSSLGYISYELNRETKKLTYSIRHWVMKDSGATSPNGSIYATDGHGFLCVPRNITQALAEQNYKFEDADAWLDLWCHTVYREPRNVFSYISPTVQFGQYGVALTLENLGTRWGWEKTKVWRFLKKHGDAFTLRKLPGSYGCLIFNNQYPTDTEFTAPTQAQIERILGQIRIFGRNAHVEGSENYRINRMIAWYRKKVRADEILPASPEPPKSRVAVLPPIIRAYLSQCWSCKNSYYDCKSKYISYTLSLADNPGKPPGANGNQVLHNAGTLCARPQIQPLTCDKYNYAICAISQIISTGGSP